MSKAEPMASQASDHAALRFVILLGVLSLFADMTYEGARSVAGSYLAVLGATGAIVGLIAGVGEFAGYGIRLFSGILSDRPGRSWWIMAMGYGVNLLAVPMLALAGRWEIAAALLVLERIGKGIRTPVRDAMLSHAAEITGRGKAFGLHEALDQIGAILGPVIVALVLWHQHAYPLTFGALALPALMALSVLGAARVAYPDPGRFGATAEPEASPALPRGFWLYLAGVALLAAGFVDFAFIAFHLERTGLVARPWIPIAYAIAMGTDALAALALGWAWDRVGPRLLGGGVLFTALAAPMIFLGGPVGLMIGLIMWGTGMGLQESIMRALLAAQVPSHRRGTAYGIFHTIYGFAWMMGSLLLGKLYDHSVPIMAWSAFAMQIGALLVLLYWAERERITLSAS
ncbi:MAG: MFS transporter [Anaerolineae bacterium]|nr:MFS transporter [Anaerolineae bacterium]